MHALKNLKVLELGQLVAGPFASRILADFGADVVKVEHARGGDPLRRWRTMRDGRSLWWEVQSRNKRSVALDLALEDDRDIVRRLAREADVLIENFRPGRLEDWGLGPDVLLESNPGLVVLRISGYGQTGPYRDKPGFGVVGEAMGGLRHLTGEPGRAPVRTGLSIGDSLAGLHGVIGVLLALRHREVDDGPGQVVDVALHESVFNVTESLLTEYTDAGVVRAPAGAALPGIAPTGAYRTADGVTVLVAGNGDRIFRDLMRIVGREDLGADPDLASNDGRARRAAELDEAIEAWTSTVSADEALALLDAASVPAGRAYTAADIAQDPHYQARQMLLRSTTVDGCGVTLPGIVPKLSVTPGTLRTPAPTLGEHDADCRSSQGWPARERSSS